MASEGNDARCQVDDCNGATVRASCCVGHVNHTDLGLYLRGLQPGAVLQANGARISPDRSQTLARWLNEADVFASFEGATFDGEAFFTTTTFTGGASFNEATFDYALFGGATFTRDAFFNKTRFTGDAFFNKTRFTGGASFNKATFTGLAFFAGAMFIGDAFFEGATFDGEALFDGATFTGGASFDKATFGRWCKLGPLRAAFVSLSSAVFNESAEIHVRARTVQADHVRCREALTLTLATGTLDLSSARFAAPATSAASPSKIEFPGQTDADGQQRYAPQEWDAPDAPPPRLLTVEAADLTNLTVAGVDLSACRFIGAYNLDKLHIDGPPDFAETQPRQGWTKRLTLAEERNWRVIYDRRSTDWYPLRERLDQVLTLEFRALSLDPKASRPSDAARALALADYPWRSNEAREKYAQIREEVTLSHDWLAARTTAAGTEAARVQAAYRELRKSFEDAKNEPGAADFYYGEMEMRRMASRAAPPHRFENALLTAYWAVSGYGLRASRAFLALLLALAIGTVMFATVGFGHYEKTVYVVPVPSTRVDNQPVAYKQTTELDGKPTIRDAAYYSVQSATSLLREPTTEPLTTIGRITEITLRLLGPLLLGLALLALRGRVKR